MTTLHQAHDLATNYVETDAPNIVCGENYHLFAEKDTFLMGYLSDKHDCEINPTQYNRQSALKEYWDDIDHGHWDKFEWDHGNGDEGFPLWPCEFLGADKYAECVDLMHEHAPGVALTKATEFEEKTGLTFAKSTVEGRMRDERDTDDTRDLRLAIAYVCMGLLQKHLNMSDY